MTSAVEAMAKSRVEHRGMKWYQLSPGQRAQEIELQRIALAALAEVELPVSALIAAEKVAEDCKGEEFMDVTFRAIVGVLSEEVSDGD